MTIGERIRNRRKELNMSQLELGKRLGITKSAVCRVETDKEQNLTLDRVAKYAKALSCSESYLMGWSEESQKILMNAAESALRQKKIDRLPPEGIAELDNYIDYLLSKYSE